MSVSTVSEFGQRQAFISLFQQYKATKPEDLPGMEPYMQLETEELKKLIDYQTAKVFNYARSDLYNLVSEFRWLSGDRYGHEGIDASLLKCLEKEGVLVQFYAFLKFLKSQPKTGQ